LGVVVVPGEDNDDEEDNPLTGGGTIIPSRRRKNKEMGKRENWTKLWSILLVPVVLNIRGKEIMG
jgi:hypothetical protein